MGIIKRQVFRIPIDSINGIDDLFKRLSGCDKNNSYANLQAAYAHTRRLAYNYFSISSISGSIEVKRVDDDGILLSSGEVLSSKLLPQVLANSQEICFFITTLHGLDEIESIEKDVLNKLFLDYWGTSFLECGNKWILDLLRKELNFQGLYTTDVFCPGQHDIPLNAQSIIFDLLKPQPIEVSLKDGFVMHPKKSLSGMFGIKRDEDINFKRSCDFCNRKDDCPTSYV